MPSHEKTSRESGQALVETALTLPILILILSGLLDLGRLYYTYIALEDAANESAIYMASVNPWCRLPTDVPPAGNPQAPASCQDPRNGFYRARNSGLQEVNWALVAAENRISFRDFTGAAYDPATSLIVAGQQITVEITYPFQPIMPIIKDLLGNSVELRVSSTHTIINIQ